MPLPTWTDTQVIDQLNSGAKWTGPTITYAFATSTAGLTGAYATFSAFTATQQAAAIIALGLWDDLIAPDLVLTTSTASDIEFANSYNGLNYALAYIPTDGTVWMNNAYNGTGNTGLNSLNNNLVNPVIGRHGFSTYVHEIGHAMGLDHSGDYDVAEVPSNFRDSTVYSVMSYFGPSWGSGGEPTLVAWADWVGSDGVLYEPQTMMIDDILTIQSMYGAETTTRTGNTTYGFNSTLSNSAGGIYDFTLNLNPILCLYDSGGIDTLDLSGWNTQCLIDLTAGAFSSANSMTNNISIAYGVQIENATAGGGNDTLTGNAANNVLSGGAGADILNGGLGDDTLIGGVGADQLNGEGGSDTASYAGSTAGVTVSLALATAQVSGGDASGDVLTAIANLIGSSHADTLKGNTAANTLSGGNGNDILEGGFGNDYLNGDLGDDTLNGGLGVDVMDGGAGNDTVSYANNATGVYANLALQHAWDGSSMDFFASIEKLIGSSHADNFVGSSQNDILIGESGDDTLNGGLGVDVMDGGAGNDTMIGGIGADTFRFAGQSLGIDKISDYEDGFDRLSFDRMIADDFSDFLITGNGTNTVVLSLIIDVSNTLTLSGLWNITISNADFDFI
jgi:serralysin